MAFSQLEFLLLNFFMFNSTEQESYPAEKYYKMSAMVDIYT